MAEKKTIKIAQISKDFNLKSKDVLDVFKEVGLEKKTGGGAESEEYELFIHKITASHQIKNIDDYIDGKTKVSVIAPKSEEKPTAEPEKKAEAPKADAPKPEAAKPEAPKPASAPKAEAKVERAPQPKFEAKPEQRPAPDRQQRFEQRDRRVDGPRDNRPRQGTTENNPNVYRPQDKKQNNNYQRYNDRPGDDPFAKRRNDMNRAAEGFRKSGQQQGQRPDVKRPEPVKQQTPVKVQSADASALRPAQQAALEKAQKAQAAPQPQKKAEPKKEQQKAQKRELRTITPTIDMKNVKGGVNINAEYTAQQPKTRVVDMRTSDVNLSKYDDRYNDRFFAIANGGDTKAQKQKLKKQDNRGQNQKSAKDKERAAQEKIKRMEAERARNKQLEITVPDEITVSELAIRLKKTSGEVIKKLMMMGEMKGLNDVIDYATAELIADE